MPVMVGFDPGRDKSFAALVVLDQARPPQVHPHELAPDDRRSLAEVLGPRPPATYTLRFLQRFSRDLSHPQIINAVVAMYEHPSLPTPKTLLVDATSLGGHMAADLFQLARIRPKPVVWHGGLSATRVGDEWHVSKSRMVAALLTLVETRRLKMSPTLAYGEAIIEEMQQYLREQSPETGREKFHAPSTGAYDDLISATLMCAWWGEQRGGQMGYSVPYRL